MAKEIERKFLVKNDSFKHIAQSSVIIEQGYLSRNPEATIRIRITNSQGYITVKSKNIGIVRSEWEYQIPEQDAREMLSLCNGLIISKTRWIVNYEKHKWEVDEFHGSLAGLILAEAELKSADDMLDIPPFIEKEVSGDPQYYNSNLEALSKEP